MKKTGLNGYVYYFSVDCDAIAVVKKCFLRAMTFFDCNVLKVNPLKV